LKLLKEKSVEIGRLQEENLSLTHKLTEYFHTMQAYRKYELRVNAKQCQF